MALQWVRMAEGEQSVLAATLVSLGLTPAYFERAMGWNYGVEHHRYESSEHCVAADDDAGLRGIVGERAATEPRFWFDYIGRCVSRGARLVGTARSLVDVAQNPGGPTELVGGLTAFAVATKEMAPFLAATPMVQAALESVLADRITAERPRSMPELKPVPFLLRSLRRSAESVAALREMRDGYRMALKIAENDRACHFLLGSSPAVAAGRLEREFPELYGLMGRHLQDYGWIWARGGKGEEPSPTGLLERLQGVLLRWTVDMVREAAERTPGAAADGLLGFSPSGDLAELISAYQEMSTAPSFGLDVHRQAEFMAAPFFATVADILGCTTEQLMFASWEEILAALVGDAALPIAEIDRRVRNSFVVERAGPELVIVACGTASAERQRAGPAAGLTGMSVSRGRAVGTVKVVLGAWEVTRVAVGDVVVTATSSPDVIGGESIFPTRSGLTGIERAAAIVTDEGGSLSHAGIISREYGIPCVVGTERATSTLVDGQVVEVDATRPTGRVIPLGCS